MTLVLGVEGAKPPEPTCSTGVSTAGSSTASGACPVDRDKNGSTSSFGSFGVEHTEVEGVVVVWRSLSSAVFLLLDCLAEPNAERDEFSEEIDADEGRSGDGDRTLELIGSVTDWDE